MASPPPPGPAGSPPSRTELLSAYGTTVGDLVHPGVRLLLCGINPSLWSGYAGYHFARPANRLWRSLAESGLTPRVLHPSETDVLAACGIGITNFVARATARADELADDEIRAGVGALRTLVLDHQPRWLAVLGLGAYRLGFGDRTATVGPQDLRIGETRVWLLPNPSGLNAHYTQAALSAAFSDLADAVGRAPGAAA